MSWRELHKVGEQCATRAEIALRDGKATDAAKLYGEAAEAEEQALSKLDSTKPRTLGISAVSAVSLWYKAKEYERAQAAAYKWLLTGQLPQFACDQLKDLLQSIWSESDRTQAALPFARDQVIVAVKGGDVVKGGAPLDLILQKVETVRAFFYRTTEFIQKLPHRKGPPTREVQEICRPWLFQTAPGSYQFAVTVQEPAQQLDFLEPARPKPREITAHFLKILRASVDDPEGALSDIVADVQYRGTFLKLTRNLTPTGRTFSRMDIWSSDDPHPITLLKSARKTLNRVIQKAVTGQTEEAESQHEPLRGILRGLHLDKDWLEVALEENRSIHVTKAGDEVDDVIGPMVNRPVIVHTAKTRQGKYLFRDIELDE